MPQLRPNTQAPAPRVPRYGLIAAAPTVDDPDLRLLAGGFAFQPEGCGLGGRTSITCTGSVVDDMDPADLTSPDVIRGDAVWVWAMDSCSSFGFNARDWEGRARRQLAATESFQLANELWTGRETLQPTPDLENRFLAMPGTESDQVTAGPTAIVAALGCVEAALASHLQGQPGMIHVTPQVLIHAAAAYAIERQGNVWVTPMGNVVVADAGYDGSAPGGASAGSSQWIYGTATIQVRLGPVEIIPGDITDARNLAAAMDRAVNDITVVAGRLAAFQWSNECAHVAAEVNIPVCLVGGTS